MNRRFAILATLLTLSLTAPAVFASKHKHKNKSSDSSSSNCSQYTDKDSCKGAHGCKWKKKLVGSNKCVAR